MPQIHVNLAASYLSLKDYNKAEVALRRALELDPTNTQVDRSQNPPRSPNVIEIIISLKLCEVGSLTRGFERSLG